MTTPGLDESSVSPATTKSAIPWTSWACLLLTGGIILFPLTYAWSYFEDYAFGWWVPPIALFLCWEHWSTRPAPEPTGRQPKVGRFILGWALLFFCSRMALETSMSSRPLLLCCALLYVGALLYWLWIYGGMAWLRHFAFPVCFLLISVPWLFPIEDPIVQGLAQFNAWMVAHVLVLFGIYAQATGNVIVLPDCTLGVEAACSGIRSLQAALMVALLMGEFYRFSGPRRCGIILLALVTALVGNFLRALLLSFVASSKGVLVMSHWHDDAGVSILALTLVTTGLVTFFLAHRYPGPSSPRKNSPQPWSPSQGSMAQRLACGIFLATALGAVSTDGWFTWGEHHVTSYPTWTASLPASGNATDLPIPEESSQMLKFDAGRAVEWQDEQGWSWIAFWFRYHPKPGLEITFQAHNPDHCLPSAGFIKVMDKEPFVAHAHGVELKINPKQFSWKGTPVYVFWVVYANRSNFPVEKMDLSGGFNLKVKTLFYLSNIWNARRTSKSEMESLEICVIGPDNYPAAQSAYLTELQKVIVPDADQPTLAKAAVRP